MHGDLMESCRFRSVSSYVAECLPVFSTVISGGFCLVWNNYFCQLWRPPSVQRLCDRVQPDSNSITCFPDHYIRSAGFCHSVDFSSKQSSAGHRRLLKIPVFDLNLRSKQALMDHKNHLLASGSDKQLQCLWAGGPAVRERRIMVSIWGAWTKTEVWNLFLWAAGAASLVMQLKWGGAEHCRKQSGRHWNHRENALGPHIHCRVQTEKTDVHPHSMIFDRLLAWKHQRCSSKWWAVMSEKTCRSGFRTSRHLTWVRRHSSCLVGPWRFCFLSSVQRGGSKDVWGPLLTLFLC